MSTTDSIIELGTGAMSEVQVARQPILATDEDHSLLGYELRFSDTGGLFDAFVEVDDQRAASEVLGHTVLTLGLHRVVGESRAFVRFPRTAVMEGLPLILPAGQSVIQMGPDCWAEGDRAEVGRRCQAYRAAGYEIALVDLHGDHDAEDLVRLADYITVDVGRRTETELSGALAALRRHGAAIVATGVDDEAHRDLAARAGADYVQGFFFSAPKVVSGRELPGSKLAYLQLLRAAYAEDVAFEELAAVVKRDVALSYKLLRYVNSAWFGLRDEVTSVQHALTMLGLDQVRSWVGVATVSGIVEPRSQQLAVLCATRARFAESLGRKLGLATAHRCFGLGMFSLLDVLLGRPMTEALEDVNLPDDVIAALLGEPGELGDLLTVVVAYERGEWDAVGAVVTARGWRETDLIGNYIDALEWAREFFGTTG